MSSKCKPKTTKKVVETSLGKAPKDGLDVSHVKKPISTTIYGIKQVINLFQTATSEVHDYIRYECDILYECRICRSIFRSLANFILHKREYCREKFQSGGGNPEGGYVISDDVIRTSDEETQSPCATPVDSCQINNKKILPIIERLAQKQKIESVAEELLHKDLSKNEEDDDVIFVSEQNDVVLEKIDSSQVAMFQTGIDKTKEGDNGSMMKSEILEIHRIVENQAVVGSNGKVSFPRPKQTLSCKECNISFSTEKTLTHHIKYKHNKTCIVFPCPDCKETFSNAWSVFRHLCKVHRRTISQVRRMRPLVHSGRIRQAQSERCKKRKPDPIQEESEENQWMNNIEGDTDFQMCAGCGKRFERKAALQSHSQLCTKRIALCNSIKNPKTTITKNDTKKAEVRIKGAAKRKQKAPNNVKISDVVENPKPTITNNTDFEVLTISDDDDEEMNSDDAKIIKPWTYDPLSLDISDELKEYVNDEDDHSFLVKSMSYINIEDKRCSPCEMSFMSVYMLLRHLSLHFSWYRYQCSKCQFLSFHKYDCTTHAVTTHSTPTNLMDSTVLPIPKWKVFQTCHEFRQVIESPTSSPNEDDTIILEDDDMPILTSDVASPTDDDGGGKAGPSMKINDRPIRNRTRSVKTLQNDFIYDLAKVLKINNEKRKVRKVK